MAIYTFFAVSRKAPQHEVPGRAVSIDTPEFEKHGIHIPGYPELQKGIEEVRTDSDVFMIPGDHEDDFPESYLLRTQPIRARWCPNVRKTWRIDHTTIDESEVTKVKLVYPGADKELIEQMELVNFDPFDLDEGRPVQVKRLHRYLNGTNVIAWTWINPATLAWLELAA